MMVQNKLSTDIIRVAELEQATTTLLPNVLN